jgi:hypothetical protein
MFNIGSIGGGLGANGFSNMVAQSDMDTSTVIKTFERLVAAGFNFEDALEQAFINSNVSESDLTDFDKERIRKRVKQVSAGRYNYDWR